MLGMMKAFCKTVVVFLMSIFKFFDTYGGDFIGYMLDITYLS